MITNLNEFLKKLSGSKTEIEQENCCLNASIQFVRSIDQLAIDSNEATGRKLSAFEVLQAYGKPVLFEVYLEGSAILAESVKSAGQAIRKKRKILGWTIEYLGSCTGYTEALIKKAELSKRLPIREYETLAACLGMDERFISFRSVPPSLSDKPITKKINKNGFNNLLGKALEINAISQDTKTAYLHLYSLYENSTKPVQDNLKCWVFSIHERLTHTLERINQQLSKPRAKKYA